MMSVQFKQDVHAGLSARQKSLPSKYFYDAEGDKLFSRIMHLPEYYLTRAEYEIFQTQSKDIIESLDLPFHSYFELIELGAGDGLKTKALLSLILNQFNQFSYVPIDISNYALTQLTHSLTETFSTLEVRPRQGDYFHVLHDLNIMTHPKVVMFLGSNIGNMTDELAHKFMCNLSQNLMSGDKVLLGVDLIKPATIVLPAYNDSQQVTCKFNLNLLARINRELGGEFNLDYFEHHPEYCEEEGVARSALISRRNQTIYIEALGKHYDFVEGEKIETEISRKYNDEILKQILKDTSLNIVTKFVDSKQYFADYVLEKA